MTSRKLFSLLVVVALAGAAGAAGFRTGDPAAYRSWHVVTPQPLRLPDPTAVLCNPIPGVGNPHRRSYFRVYVNPVGARRMAPSGTGAFPAGTIIVKEKLASRESRKPDLLTVMRKLPASTGGKGVDAWEFSVLDGDARPVPAARHARVKPMVSGVSHCRSCHLDAARSDFVFATYLRSR